MSVAAAKPSSKEIQRKIEFLDEDEAEIPNEEQRIDFRRWRIEHRRLKRLNLLAARNKKPDPPPQTLKSKLQTQDSRRVANAALLDAEEAVSEVARQREEWEDKRRRKTEVKLAELSTDIEREAEQSREQNQELESKWAEVAAHSVPQVLHAEIGKQHETITRIMVSKDAVIKELQKEVHLKDEEYMELLVRQQSDVQRILSLMKEKSVALTAAYQQQAQAIEDAFVAERAELIRANAEELTELSKKRTDLENRIMPKQQEQEDKYYANLVEVRNRDAEDYNLLKEKLEATIQLLEQQLEEMRATYQLNQESLIFGHKVLQECDSENKRARAQQQAKSRRLKDNVSQLVQRFQKQNAAFLAENNSLTAEYSRLVLQFQDFQAKFRHFEQVDKTKYRELWAMNEEDVMTLVRKVLAADRLIHEQILLKEWKPPFNAAAVGADATQVAPAAAGLQTTAFPSTGLMSSLTSPASAVDLGTVTAAMLMTDGVATARPRATTQTVASAAAATALKVEGAGTTAAGSKTREETARSEFHAAASQGKYSAEQVRRVMTALSEHAGFLVDARVNEASASLPASERIMYRVDAILTSLGVEDREDLDELVGCFMAEGDEEEHIHPNDVITTVNKFAEHRQQLKDTSRIGLVKVDPVASEKKARKKEKERLFWHKLGNVLPETTLRVWDTLETQQRNFSTLLRSREKLVEDTAALARQNEDLKMLMQQYTRADINKQLLMPPRMPQRF